ncbi:MAG: glycoside hydrolase family 2 protein [Limnochordia bacterium]|jgi:beta-mannosidase|nr:glycoside hydrolase family 2 protein [Limnochordia bacterium]
MRVDLSGKWQMYQERNKDQIDVEVPGDTHSALLAAGRIPDPYYGTNELDLQWIGRHDCVFTREFEVEQGLLECESVVLNCERLDTLTEIYINDQLVGETDNMFRRYRFEVRDYLFKGRNTIKIIFRSAELSAIARSKEMPYPIPMNQNPVQSPHINLVRKVACHGGWDWGCCLMVAGIYDDIYLHGTSSGRINYVYTEQTHFDDYCLVDVYVEVDSLEAHATSFVVKLAGQQITQQVSLEPGFNRLRVQLRVDQPQLWWPRGYGEQHLYDLTVCVFDEVVQKRLGLRKLEIINEEDDIGLSFKIRVNDVDIFAKGANWIPADALPARQTEERLDDLLTSAVKANMNIIRVWGGGQYEKDVFYQLCDEKGLLVWQDFMFACALYPATPDFLDNVRQEVLHQVKRLRDYACIALWCGNNECLGGLNWFEPSRKNRDRYLVDYDRLYEGTIGKAVQEADPTRLYWPSSPCGGPGDYSDCWHDDSRGDMHYWRVWHESASFDAYYQVVPRFCSEFGYQSFPSLSTIRSYASEDQLNATSPVLEHHQRNRGGNSRIIEMQTRYFRMPEGFAGFVYLSQVQQALAIKTAVEYWRHLRPTCMGTIYWQLNDNWPVCSWSSLEYSGKWKLLHYMARRFYAPLMISSFEKEEGQLEIWAVNDRTTSQQAELVVQIMDFEGNVKQEEAVSFEIAAGSAKRVRTYSIAEIAPKRHEVFAVLTMHANGEVFYNEHFFTEYKRCSLAQPKIDMRVKEIAGRFEVRLSTDRPAFYVSLDPGNIPGEFDDNCFTLLPGCDRRLVFTPKQKTSLPDFERALTLYELRGTY